LDGFELDAGDEEEMTTVARLGMNTGSVHSLVWIIEFKCKDYVQFRV